MALCHCAYHLDYKTAHEEFSSEVGFHSLLRCRCRHCLLFPVFLRRPVHSPAHIFESSSVRWLARLRQNPRGTSTQIQLCRRTNRRYLLESRMRRTPRSHISASYSPNPSSLPKSYSTHIQAPGPQKIPTASNSSPTIRATQKHGRSGRSGSSQ